MLFSEEQLIDLFVAYLLLSFFTLLFENSTEATSQDGPCSTEKCIHFENSAEATSQDGPCSTEKCIHFENSIKGNESRWPLLH